MKTDHESQTEYLLRLSMECDSYQDKYHNLLANWQDAPYMPDDVQRELDDLGNKLRSCLGELRAARSE